MTNIDLTPLFEAILTIVSLVITYKVIPWLKIKLTESQFAYMKSITETLVFAAEQIYGAGNGAKKLQYVIDNLELRGFTFDQDVIEEYVYKLTHSTQDILLTPMLQMNNAAEEEDIEGENEPIIPQDTYN